MATATKRVYEAIAGIDYAINHLLIVKEMIVVDMREYGGPLEGFTAINKSIVQLKQIKKRLKSKTVRGRLL